MPSYEEVTQRAGSLHAATGVTEAVFTALLSMAKDKIRRGPDELHR